MVKYSWMLEKLCYSCSFSREGICVFAQLAREIANNPDLDPLDKNNLIAESRIKARELECPHVNDIDPDYPGKNLL